MIYTVKSLHKIHRADLNGVTSVFQHNDEPCQASSQGNDPQSFPSCFRIDEGQSEGLDQALTNQQGNFQNLRRDKTEVTEIGRSWLNSVTFGTLGTGQTNAHFHLVGKHPDWMHL